MSNLSPLEQIALSLAQSTEVCLERISDRLAAQRQQRHEAELKELEELIRRQRNGN